MRALHIMPGAIIFALGLAALAFQQTGLAALLMFSGIGAMTIGASIADRKGI